MNKLAKFFKQFNQPYDLLDFFLGIILGISGLFFLAIAVPIGLIVIFLGLYVIWRSYHSI